MKKLKTFNELIIDWGDDAEAVRQEAINWVKELPKDAHDTVYTINWIKHFFTITEEDLK